MATKKKLLQAAAGSAGGAGLNVEEVFSTYLYTGTDQYHVIRNEINLTSLNYLPNSIGSNGRGAVKFKGNYFFCVQGVDRMSDPFGTLTFNTSISQGDFLAADSNYIYTEANNDFYYSSDGITWTQMTYNPQNSGAVSCVAGMVVLSNGTLVATHQNVITGYQSVSLTSDRGATSWSGPYLISTSGAWQSPIKMVNGTIYGCYSGGLIKYSSNGTSWSNGGTVSNAVAITYLSSGVYIVGTSTGYIHTSSTGTGSWTQQSQITTETLGIRGLVSDGTTAYAVSQGGVWSSTNGTSWTKIKNVGAPNRSYPYPQVDFDSTDNVIFFGDGAGTISVNVDDNGGLVWIKNRSSTREHSLYDTERGVAKLIKTNSTGAEQNNTTGLIGFNRDGFLMQAYADINGSAYGDFASWTFRKAPKFFDVVTYTGDGVAGRTVSHNLGSVPGCIIVKAVSGTYATRDWQVYHRGLDATSPEDKYLVLNTSAAVGDAANFWNDTAPTSTDFTLGTWTGGNGTGTTYVAYVFAHNNGDGDFGPDADADIIKCGSYTGNGSATGPTVDLGFEPQFLLVKNATGGNWVIADTMRSFGLEDMASLYPNASNAESTMIAGKGITPTATGFQCIDGNATTNQNAATHIYIAIRRGPMAVPESGTDVFFASTSAGSSSGPVSTGFPVDLFMNKATLAVSSSPRSWWVFDRMRGASKLLSTDLSDAEPAFDYSPYINFDSNDSFTQTNSSSDLGYFFGRAPNYFDVVAYTGNGTAGHTISHNLGVAPEMIWVKCRSQSTNWPVYHSGLDVDGDNLPETDYLVLSQTQAAYDNSVFWNDTAPDASTFTLGTNLQVNQSGSTYIAYLFASLAGVSKVGSYTGNGSSTGDTQTIDCGFSSGARFVLIKRTSGTGAWYVFDTARGIVSGTDKYLTLNSNAAEVSGGDYIDPHSSGFTVVQHPATETNTNGETYIFYAIA